MVLRKKASKKKMVRKSFSKKKMSRKGVSYSRKAVSRKGTQYRSRTYAPKVSYGANGVITVTHQEYVRNFSTATSFSAQSFYINPGLQSLFPWLSGVAAQYTQYDFKKLQFLLKSTSANALNSTNTALGVHGLCVIKDTMQPDPTSKVECESFQGAVSAAPSKSLIMNVNVNNRQNVLGPKYVITGNTSTDSDSRLYHEGKLVYFADSAQAASDSSELWVSYTVTLRDPRILSSVMAYNNNTSLFRVTAPTVSNLFGTLGSSAYYNDNSQMSVTFTSSNTLTFPSWVQTGDYLIVVGTEGSATPATNGSAFRTAINAGTGLTNCTPLKIFKDSSNADTCFIITGDVAGAITSSQTNIGTAFAVRITKPTASIYFGVLWVPNTSVAHVMVLPINGRILTNSYSSTRLF